MSGEMWVQVLGLVFSFLAAVGTVWAAIAASQAARSASAAVVEQRRSASTPQVIAHGGELLAMLTALHDAMAWANYHGDVASLPDGVSWHGAAAAARRLSIAIEDDELAKDIEEVGQRLDTQIFDLSEGFGEPEMVAEELLAMITEVTLVVRGTVHGGTADLPEKAS